MKAVILAAGVGLRLSTAAHYPPKALLRFGERSLLQRHLDILRTLGLRDVVVAVGYQAHLVEAEIAHVDHGLSVRTVLNPDYRNGSVLTMWTLREDFLAGEDLLLMDADVLYDERLMRRLVESKHRNCFLMDRNFEPGDEPVKLCLKDGRLAEFRKKIGTGYDLIGESVGFFRFDGEICRRLVATMAEYIDVGRINDPYEEPIRDVLLASAPGVFGYEDVTGLPWVEIDFPQDVARAEAEIMPLLIEPAPAQLPRREALR